MNVILIPYRDRGDELKYFLENSYPLLKTHLENLKIIIIEQDKGKAFNRGLTLNIGFNEMNKLNIDNCYYYTHDVDVNPHEETIKRIYCKKIEENHIMGIYTSRCNTLGGIIKFDSQTFQKINGFPNDFWGWGCEDKDLQNRVEFKKINITKNILNNSPEAKTHFKIFDNNKRDMKIPFYGFVYRKWKTLKESDKEKYISGNGLTTLKYEIIDKKKLSEDIIKIKVKV